MRYVPTNYCYQLTRRRLLQPRKRLQRMFLRLQRYNYELVYHKGSEMVLADTLSRAFPSATTDKTVFNEDLASLSSVDYDQMAELHMIASQQIIAKIMYAANDEE